MKSVLVVGSSLIDIFLRPEESHAEVNDGKVTLSLGDKVPSQLDKLSLGGNGSNIAVGLTRLEVPTYFYTWLGNDVLSREIEESISKEGVELMSASDRKNNTGLSLILTFPGDRIIFSHHEESAHEFDYKKSEKPDLVFLTSVGKEWTTTYKKVLDFCKQLNIPMAFSPGSMQIENFEVIAKEVFEYAKYLFLNKEEGQKILKSFGRDAEDIKSILSNLYSFDFEIVSVTDGTNGAYAISEDKTYKIAASSSSVAIVNKAGAGDAYASGFLAGIINGKDVPSAMEWGACNAGSVLAKVGAQDGLLTKKLMQNSLTNVNIKAEVLE